jgi:UPF0716 protein FxsA
MAKPTALMLLIRHCGEDLQSKFDQNVDRLSMIPPRRLILLLIFIAIPLIEIAVLIKVGQVIGVLPTILIIIGTAIFGLGILRGQGFSVLARASQAVAAGRTPVEPVVDGAFLMVAGMLLISPGLLADALGLILLVPVLRRIIAKSLVGGLVKSSSLHIMIFGDAGPPPAEEDRMRRQTDAGEGTIIDGEYKRIDDRDPRDTRKR